MSGKIFRPLYRIWQESSGSRLLMVSTALAGCVATCASLAFVWVTKKIVDCAVGPAHDIPLDVVGLLIGCLLLQLVVPAVRKRLETKAYTTYTAAMRSRLLSHLLGERWSGKGGMRAGDAISRMNEDVATVASLTCSTVPGLLSVGLQLVGAFIFLAFLDLRLAAAIVVIMPAALIASKVYLGRTRRLTREIREGEGALQSFLQESLRHRTLLSTLMGEERRTAEYGSQQAALIRKIVKRSDISIYSNSAVAAGFMAGYTVAFLWSAFGLASGAVSFGVMTALLQLVAQVQRPVVDFSRRIPAFVNASVAIERIDGILGSPLEDRSGAPMRGKSAPGLRFSDVCFTYPDGDREIICRLSHDFRPGSITCITGATGAGKSTLLRIMLGLVEPTSGYAEMYNSEGEKRPVSPGLRTDIVYVPQGNSLMCGTVRDNLLLAAPEASDGELREVLHAAAADFVFELPDGLDTKCSEGGGGFSEGQAQRIAIARGLLKKGGLVLLDEPTSALDIETEEILLTSLADRLKGRCTVIMVTHRKAALGFCTDILDLT